MKTKQVIFNTALNLFAEDGYDITSIRKIVVKVGITESSFYAHYKSKQQLLEDILDVAYDFFIQEMPTTAERVNLAKEHNLSDALHLMGEIFLKTWGNPQAVQLWQIVSNEQYRNEKAKNIILDGKKHRVEGMIAVFEVFRKQGKLRLFDILQVAYTYVNALHSIFNDAILNQLSIADNNHFADRMNQTIDMFVSLCEKENVINKEK